MARLIYSAIASLDGYTVDADGRFDWAAPDEAVHASVNDLIRPVGTYLYGRRMYDTMAVWQTMGEGEPPVVQDFADLWRAADKVVYSTTLTEVTTPRTRLVPAFDPAEVRDLLDRTDRDVGIGGPGLAAAAIRAGLVDEYHLVLVPILVGGGTRALPDGIRIPLDLREERRFADGTMLLRYTRRAS